MKKVKFALIGCGRISPNYFDAISKCDIAELVAICDVDIDKAKKLPRIIMFLHIIAILMIC